MKQENLQQSQLGITVLSQFAKIHAVVFKVLFFAFVFATLHTAIHNGFEKNHDSDCPVYVLEQLYFSSDVLDFTPLSIVFTAFLVFYFTLTTYRYEAPKLFSIRAPPSL